VTGVDFLTEIEDRHERVPFRYENLSTGRLYRGVFEIVSSHPVQLLDLTWATSFDCFGNLLTGERTRFAIVARGDKFRVADFTVTAQQQPETAEEKTA
jgi:hypothetical protein